MARPTPARWKITKAEGKAAEQQDHLNYDSCPEQSRDIHFAKAEKRERYERLKQALFSRLAQFNTEEG